ncbi:MAG: hypothetical protein JOZ62_18610 [Acidobacteriaceae bacterium]|nr:hypothetical protein [Acidobacteriaceae bacterium]
MRKYCCLLVLYILAGGVLAGTGRAENAAQQLKQEEQQRILGLVPDFNTSNILDAAPLSSEQKYQLALKGELDPFAFVAAGFDAALSQKSNSFRGYGQGAGGYSHRFQASYADGFDGALLGNALFPSLLHQDPRYFRKGSGSFKSRALYSMLSAVQCKDDNGRWALNYSNLLGNVAAGGIANLYYPSTDRGAALTFQRALTVTAEGTLGTAFSEFWPDISRKLFHGR